MSNPDVAEGDDPCRELCISIQITVSPGAVMDHSNLGIYASAQ